MEFFKVGIICITPKNQHNPWVMFEAGALSKTLSETFVCPYLYDLSPSQLSGPMSQFQATLATKDGTAKTIQTLNKAQPISPIRENPPEAESDITAITVINTVAYEKKQALVMTFRP